MFTLAKVVDNIFVVSMIGRRHRAVVVKIACLVGILYLLGMIKAGTDSPSEEEEVSGNVDQEVQSGDQLKEEVPNFEPPRLEPPKLEPPILEQAKPDDGDADDVVAPQPDADQQIQGGQNGEEEKEDEGKKEEEEEEKKRLEEKLEKKEEDKELDLVAAPPKRPEGPGEMGKPYKVLRKSPTNFSTDFELECQGRVW